MPAFANRNWICCLALLMLSACGSNTLATDWEHFNYKQMACANSTAAGCQSDKDDDLSNISKGGKSSR